MIRRMRRMNEALSAKAKKFAKMYAYLEDEATSRGATAKRAAKWMEDLDGIMMDHLPGLTDSPAYDFDQIRDEEVQDLLWDKACTVTGLYESYGRRRMNEFIEPLRFKGSEYEDFDQIDAISYNYGISGVEARKGIESGEYTENDIKNAILWWENRDLPYKDHTYIVDREKKRLHLKENRRMNESAGFYGRNLNSRDESYEVDVYLCKLLAKKEKCNWKEVQLVSDNHRVPGYEMFDTIDRSMSDRRCISKPIDVSDYDDPDDPGYRATLIQNSEGCYTIRLYDEYSKVTTYFINPTTWY